jgi:hypothetical protein
MIHYIVIYLPRIELFVNEVMNPQIKTIRMRIK